MTLRERDIAPGVNQRRNQISSIDTQLRDLKSTPGKEDPAYLAQRISLLAERSFLSKVQTGDRRRLRQANRQVR